MSARGTGPDALSRAIAIAIAAKTNEDDDYWELIEPLRKFPPSQLFHRIAPLAHNPDARVRAIVPDVLRGVHAVAARTIHLLKTMLGAAAAAELSSIAFALGELDAVEARVQMLPFARHHHEDVRHAVACVIPCSADDAAIAALIELTSDVDSDVRDWATFGLGTQIDRDTPEIRDALAARLDDEDDDTRSEALVGLAKRKDRRALERLIRALAHREDCWPLYLEAACELAAPELVPLLREREADLRALGRSPTFDDAIAACRGE